MNRKDTIIVAVLINAALLVILFVSALKNEPASIAKQEKSSTLDKHVAIVKKEPAIAKSNPDQVDHILAQYSKKVVKESLKESVKEEKKTDLQSLKPQENTAPKEETIKVLPSKVSVEKHVEKEVMKKITSKEKQEDVLKVVVKKGDVLEKIAKIYGTTVGALMQENQLTDSRLQIGQVLQIPKEREMAQSVAAPMQLEEKYYIVKNGDNLWKIAIENHLKVEDLLHMNQLNEKQAKALRPGDRLKIQ